MKDLSETPAPAHRVDVRDMLVARLEGADDGLPLDLRGVKVFDMDLSGIDLAACDLSGADFSRCDFTDAVLFGAKLVETTLFQSTLDGAELSGADLTRANLTEASCQRAGFGMAKLVGARIDRADLSHASLTEADLSEASAQAAKLEHVRALDATLVKTDMTRASLCYAEISRSDVEGACFEAADLQHIRFANLANYTSANWLRTDLRSVDFTGAYLCRRFIHDQNYLVEFRAQSKANEIIYHVWKATSDCGRSLGRWAALTAGIALLFAWIYTLVGVDFGSYETSLSPLYYSVVTLTTLGYGDVLPTTVGGQVAAMIQVVIGYVMLGGLLSIFSNKMASRAD